MEQIMIGIVTLLMYFNISPASTMETPVMENNTRPLFQTIDYIEPKLFAPKAWYIFNAYETDNYTTVGWSGCCGTGRVIAVAWVTDDTSDYNPAYFDQVMINWQPYVAEATCATEDESILLFEHAANNGAGDEYLSKYWVDKTNPDVTYRVHMLVKTEDADLMDTYSESFFPDLADCPLEKTDVDVEATREVESIFEIFAPTDSDTEIDETNSDVTEEDGD